MATKKCIIIEDESHARELLKDLIQQSSRDLIVAGEASDVESGIELIAYEKPDVVFLDVRINDRLGFEVLDRYPKRDFHVVFTTAFDHYAVEAFNYDAVHYLLKPYSLTALEKALERCFTTNSNELQHSTSSIISIPNRSETIRVKSSDILYLVGAGAYTEIYIRGGKSILASKAIGFFEKLLAENDHLKRAHKKYIVNLHEVKKYEKGAKATLHMTDGREFDVSRTYKAELAKHL